RTVSDSRRWLTRALWPGRRRSRSGWMSASARGRRGGQPSTTTPMAAPWDSPQVVTRKSWPKLLPTLRARIADEAPPAYITGRPSPRGVPVAGPPSVDDPVRALQHRRRDGQAQGLGRPEVDHQVKLGRLLHRELPRLGPLEDPVHVGRGPATEAEPVR